MTVMPSGVALALASTGALDAGALNSSATFIDCRAWTANLRGAYEGGSRWKAPVHYSVAPLTELLSYANLWPGESASTLREAQRQLDDYVAKCGYQHPDFEAWRAAVDASDTYTACPAVDARCVLGT